MTKLNKLAKVSLLTTAFSASVFQVAQAGFTTNDLYLGFTQSTAQSDYIIDLGKPSAVGVGSSSAVDLGKDFSLATFNSVFTGGASGVSMAVVGGNTAFGQFGVYATQVRIGGAGNPAVAGSNIVVGHSSTAMSGGAAAVASILSSTVNGLPTAGNSVVDSTKSYTTVVNTTGVQNNFIGKTGVTPSGTFGSSAILYLDLYHAAVSAPYTYLGYFTMDLSTSTPKFTFMPSAAPGTTNTPPPSPALSIARTSNVNTISFVTSNAVTYKLFFTNSSGLTAPVTNWPSLPGTITGDGTTKSFTDTTTDAGRVYRVGAH
jgi:hypothetical protein